MTYDTVYDPDSLGLDTEESLRSHRLAVSKLSRLGTGITRDWDPVHIVLAVSIIMFNTDFVDLDDRAEAERVQMIYIRLLYR